MAKFTKQVICASFLKLLNERPLDQVTVKDIVEDCGINRKTFYYYFSDIYGILDECFRTELNRIRSGLPNDVSWQEAQKALAASMLKNKVALLHIYHAINDKELEKTAYDTAMVTLPALIKKKAGDLNIDESDILLIADLYASVLASHLVRWVRDGMRDDPGERIDHIDAIMKGTVEVAIANASQLKSKN